jgi:hypothetical protein
MNKLPLIYIAGPFRADTAWAIEKNVREAERWGLEVAKLGAIPVIPHSMYRFFHGALPDTFWIEAALTLLRSCTTILVVDYFSSLRWRASEGTMGEVDEMQRLGRPVFFLDAIDADWLSNWIKRYIALQSKGSINDTTSRDHRNLP